MSDYLLKTKLRNDCRQLHINDLVWQYKIGQKYICIYSPENKKFNILVGKFLVEKSPHWCCHDCSGPRYQDITPAIIKSYIEKNLC